jgi:hypothetical protein
LRFQERFGKRSVPQKPVPNEVVFPSAKNWQPPCSGGSLIASQLLANVSRFAAAKSVACNRLLESDRQKDGDRRTGDERMIQTFDYWQQTEENTARMRARSAKQWDGFTSGDHAALFPNIRWLRSVSIDKREDHEAFAGHIWAKNDPFWDTNMPGQDWNCKCDMQETSEPVTDGNGGVARLAKPVPAGLEGNPALTGEIFTDRAGYFRKAGKEADGTFKYHYREQLKEKYNQPPVKIDAPNLETKQLKKSNLAVKNMVNHAYNSMELGLADWLLTDVSELKNPQPEALGKGKNMSDPKVAKNLKNKEKRGVRGYVAYDLTAMGKTWTVKTERMKGGYEQLYSISPIK